MSIENILNNSDKILTGTNSCQFQLIRKMKFYSGEDTIILKGNVCLEKINDDTVGKAKFSIQYLDTLSDKIYVEIIGDGRKYLSFNYKKKEGFFIDFDLMPPEYLKENMDPDFIPDFIFINRNEISYILNQYKTHLEMMGDNVLNDLDSVYKVRFPLKDDSSVVLPCYNSYIEFQIRKSDYFPVKYKSYSETVSLGERQSQYKEFIFSDISLNPKIPDSTFDIPTIYENASKNFVIEDVKPRIEKFIDSMSIAPEFKLADSNGDSLSLSSLRGKVVLLDFWYRSCYGCILAMPEMEKLKESFKNQDVEILGINGKSDDTKFIKRYKDKFDIKYTICVNGEIAAKSYLVNAFPTFYIVDKKGRIRFSKIGYSEDFYTTMQLKITELLNEK